MSVRKKVIVAFHLEVEEDEWSEECEYQGELLADIATYLDGLVGDTNSNDDSYYLSKPVVYWPEDFIADVAEGAFSEEWEGEGEPTVVCCFCKQEVPARTAHLHQGEWVGDECCWIEQLRASE